ncbi:zinc ribbon domain-containing protein [Martelella soudanensis]|uniref:zinc ribbon domain-containing protein n=1 Tax=unclassified Martelella TaxID=2629616 RepID=UPI001FED3D95|nr:MULTISPECIES: zinc ribbon domain-containing protein [unclassified Martelella]
MKNQLNGKRQPRSLLSGLVFCGCCGGPYSLRGAGRFACSNHISKGTCPNSRTIRQDELESRVLSGLRDHMMAPEIAAEVMRAYREAQRTRLSHPVARAVAQGMLELLRRADHDFSEMKPRNPHAFLQP